MLSIAEAWKKAWKASQNHIRINAVLCLVALNGIEISQAEKITFADITFEEGWLRTPEGYYPLVQQTQLALQALPQADGPIFELGEIQQIFDHLKITEGDAHRRLAGAIWMTSEEGKLVWELSGMREAPILPLHYTFPFSIISRLSPQADADLAQQSRQTLQVAIDWLLNETFPSATPKSLQGIITVLLSGRILFLLTSTGVNGLNFLHNLVMGRLLSPDTYGEMTVIITLTLLFGLVPSVLQTVTARFGAAYHAWGQSKRQHELHLYGSKLAWSIGGILFILTLILSDPLANLFQLSSRWLLLPIALSWPCLMAMGPDRGLLQAVGSFYWLSGAYLSEAFVRLGVGVALALALSSSNRSLDGVIWAIGQSIVITWAISWLASQHFRPELQGDPVDTDEKKNWQKLMGLTLIGLVGQALITNSDIMLVKILFDGKDAGLYSAITVLGRITYFSVLPLTIVFVPQISRQYALGESTRKSLMLLVGGGAAICGVLLFLATLMPSFILRTLYGSEYAGIAYLLPVYTLAAALFVLTNLVIMYRLAIGHGSETWMLLAAGVLQILGILIFHQSLTQVVVVQICLMSFLLIGTGATLWKERV